MEDIRLEGLNTEFEWSYPSNRHPKVADLLKPYSSPNLLDIGCGNGHTASFVREVLHVDKVDGIDIMADKINAPYWLRLLKVDIDKQDLPYADNSFDAVCCVEVIEHIYDNDHLLDEIHRVLSPRGVAVLTTPNLASWVNRFMLLAGYQPFSVPVSPRYERAGELKTVYTLGHRGHFRVVTWKGFRELLKLHGFRILKMEGWVVGDMSLYLHPKAFGKFIEAVDWTFSRIPSLAYRMAVVVKKEK